MGILDEILKKKRERLALSTARRPLTELKARIVDMEKPRAFAEAVRGRNGRLRLIAEIKKASPSKGVIRADFDPPSIARIYDEKADAISVLTEEDFFMGDIGFIELVKRVSKRPVIRKDFIFDSYQIYESRAAGADAILLIERILEKEKAGEFIAMAQELGMAVLFEVDGNRGLETALGLNAPIIGINNRNLDTLKIDLGNTLQMKKEIPGDRIVVSESGIDTREDIARLRDAGIDAVLIGTAFMQAGDIGKKIDEMLK